MSLYGCRSPLRGRWLYDVPDLSYFIFNIDDYKTYPPEITRCCLIGIQEALDEFKNPRDHNGRKMETLTDIGVYDQDVGQVERLFKIVRIIREAVVSSYNLRHLVNVPKYSFPLVTDSLHDAEGQERAFNYLRMARTAIFGGQSLDFVAKANNVNEKNLRIWVSTFLTHGPLCFYRKPMEIGPELEAHIVERHIKCESSVVYTCSKFAILNYKRLKHMCRRQNRLMSDSN